jgi:hypothetical protein
MSLELYIVLLLGFLMDVNNSANILSSWFFYIVASGSLDENEQQQ